MTTEYERYCQLRDSKGLKDSDVSKGAGVSKSTFSDWKAGRYVPKTDKMVKIATFLDTTVEYLTAGVNNANDDTAIFSAKDERDIKKDLENIMNKLRNNEDGPASFDGEEIPEADQELFAGQVELMLRRLKAINKEKYNPNKNKK